MRSEGLWFTEITSLLNMLFKESSEIQLTFSCKGHRATRSIVLGTGNSGEIDIQYMEGTTKARVKIEQNLEHTYLDFLKTALIQAGVLPLDFSAVDKILKKASSELVVRIFLDTNIFILRGISNYFYQKAKRRQLSFILLYATPVIRNELGRMYEKNRNVITLKSGQNNAEIKSKMKFANALIGLREYDMYLQSGFVRTVHVSDENLFRSLHIGDGAIYREYVSFMQRIPNRIVYFLTADKGYSARASSFPSIAINQNLPIPKEVDVNVRVLPSLVYTLATMFGEVKVASACNPWFHLTFTGTYDYDLNGPWVNLVFSESSGYSSNVKHRVEEILRRLKILRKVRITRNEIVGRTLGGGVVNEIY